MKPFFYTCFFIYVLIILFEEVVLFLDVSFVRFLTNGVFKRLFLRLNGYFFFCIAIQLVSYLQDG